MQHRFCFLGTLQEDGMWLVDHADEVRHALQILRLVADTEVEVRDGQGRYAVGSLVPDSKRSFFVQVDDTDTQFTPRPASPLAMALGILKPSDVDELIPFLSGLGIDELHLFGGAGVAKDRFKPLPRWQRIARQSIKQCKRDWSLNIETHATLQAFVDSQASRFEARGVLDETGGPLAEFDLSQSGVLVCGGEKGLDDDEAALLAAKGFLPQSLGPYVMLARHAVCAAASIASQSRLLSK